MKRILFLSLLTMQLTWMSGARAEKADADKPSNVEATQFTLDDIKQVKIFTGNVVLTRGTLLINADKVVVTTDPSGYQFVTLYAASGGLATFHQKRDSGPDLWIDGEAERIEYSDKTDIFKLFSKAQIRRLQGTKLTDVVNGEFISYDSRTEFYAVSNDVSGTSQMGGGRIKAVIQPKKK
ncbi:MAG: lipopolysaccharide transport periplasmic protein LptA [Glaciimonas sp.]|nr:lipopolysaccharide transport periplasmic protein LptA [Glaciimonas sp.]